jgi:hypothetical protein
VVTDHGYGAELPNGVLVAGWLLRDVERWARRPWLRRCHLLLAGSAEVEHALAALGRHAIPFPADGDWGARARELTDIVHTSNRNWRFCLKLPRAGGSGGRTLALAGELRRELERRGHVCTVQLADEWERLDGLTADVTVSLAGAYDPKPAQLNMLLLLEEPPGEEALAGGFDVVAADSGPLAERLGRLAPLPPLTSLGLDGAEGAGSAVDRLLEALRQAAADTGYAASVAEPA